MKIAFAILSLLLAPATAERVSYDGYKVFRVPSGGNASPIDDVVAKLKLDTWHGVQARTSFADVVVPPSKLSQWEEMASGFAPITMHDNLGASIEEESSFITYSGEY